MHAELDARQAMQRWRLSAELFAWRHGWLLPMLVVAWLVLLLGGMHWHAVEQRRMADHEQGLHALRQQIILAERQATSAAAEVGRQQALTPKTLASLLPERPQQLRQLARIDGLIAATGQRWLSSPYKEVRSPDGLLNRMTFQIEGRMSYPVVRQMLEQVLVEHPNASVDMLTLKRTDALQGQGDARLVVSLWGRGP